MTEGIVFLKLLVILALFRMLNVYMSDKMARWVHKKASRRPHD